ncbi:MAG TPA: hypothetical protein VGQ21_16050 [Thermoanaerobaculia bacterium]|nr:hypothetical protein [Thermoanaerobaculia bacterium]
MSLDPFFIYWCIAVIVIGIITTVMRGSSAVTKRLSALVGSFGWEAPRRIWWNGAWRGRWRGFPVELRHIGRQKNVPERLVLTVSATSPARVSVSRRGGFLSKPLALFGPPLVEPMNLANREQYWIRSDELALVERLFSRADVAPEFERNLISKFDAVKLQTNRLRIVRAVDDRNVKQRFNRPLIKFGRDYELIETIASEEWKLAVAIIEALGLRGYEAG